LLFGKIHSSKTFILIILLCTGISCTIQNVSDVPEYSSGLHELVVLQPNSEEFLIKMFAYNGDYIRAFYIPLEKKTLTRDELLNMYGDVGKATQNLLQNAELPETWPALGDILMDDQNRLWVSTIPESDNLTYEWFVLQDTGDLLVKFRWPGNRSIEKIKNGYLYARETDESTSIQTIVKYRIEMNQKH